MISTADRKFYLDPIQDMAAITTRLYVTEEYAARPSTPRVNTIVDVKPGIHQCGRRWWWLTVDGYYVYGAPVGVARPQHYRDYIAPDGQDGFLLGELSTVNGTEPVTAVLDRVVRSDGRVMPAVEGGHRRRVTDWMRAAPWARALMPEAGEDAATVLVKVQVARAKWEERHAMGIILSEGMERNWNDDLEELRNDHSIPTPTFGAYINGSVTLPLRGESVTVSDLPESTQERIKALNPEASSILPTRVEVPAQFFASTSVTTREDFDTLTHQTITQHARSHFNNYDLEVSGYSSTPVLRSAV